MMTLELPIPTGRNLKILCLGAHSDDIEIGCGGTLIQLIDKYPECEIMWVVLGANELRAEEASKSAGIYLARVQNKNVVVKHFRDGFFPYHGEALKEFFEEFRLQFSPDIVFTHYRKDLHQDHRIVSELTWNSFRDHLILEYEILKYDGDLGSPNVFFPLSRTAWKKKVERLTECFTSQLNHSWFDEQTFLALPRIRGVEANSPTKLAEAFYSRKISLGLLPK